LREEQDWEKIGLGLGARSLEAVVPAGAQSPREIDLEAGDCPPVTGRDRHPPEEIVRVETIKDC
jgi:hypothetical protein